MTLGIYKVLTRFGVKSYPLESGLKDRSLHERKDFISSYTQEGIELSFLYHAEDALHLKKEVTRFIRSHKDLNFPYTNPEQFEEFFREDNINTPDSFGMSRSGFLEITNTESSLNFVRLKLHKIKNDFIVMSIVCGLLESTSYKLLQTRGSSAYLEQRIWIQLVPRRGKVYCSAGQYYHSKLVRERAFHISNIKRYLGNYFSNYLSITSLDLIHVTHVDPITATKELCLEIEREGYGYPTITNNEVSFLLARPTSEDSSAFIYRGGSIRGDNFRITYFTEYIHIFQLLSGVLIGSREEIFRLLNESTNSPNLKSLYELNSKVHQLKYAVQKIQKLMKHDDLFRIYQEDYTSFTDIYSGSSSFTTLNIQIKRDLEESQNAIAIAEDKIGAEIDITSSRSSMQLSRTANLIGCLAIALALLAFLAQVFPFWTKSAICSLEPYLQSSMSVICEYEQKESLKP